MKISFDQQGINKALRKLSKLGSEAPKLTTRALNKTAAKARTLASQEIREQVNLKAAYVKDKLRVKKANYSKQEVIISATKRGVLMTRYPHRVLRRGVSVKIKRRGARAKIDGAFKTTVNAGGRKVDVIAVRSSGRYNNGNQKFDVLYSPSVSQVFGGVRRDILKPVSVYLEKQIEHELKRTLKRAS